MNLNGVWNRRAGAFLKEALTYWGYAARSGLMTFFMLFFIIGIYYYMKALQNLPPHFPYWRITTPLLAFALAWSPYRTFLKEPDEVFLMPGEKRMKGYWHRSFWYSFTFQAAGLTGLLLSLWPLYLQAAGKTEAKSFIAVWVCLLAAKAAGLLSRREESRLLYTHQRVLISLMRWIFAVTAGFIVLVQALWLFIAVFAVAVLLTGLALAPLPKHRIPWAYLIQKEKEHLNAHYTFFSWFTDVPKLPVKPKERKFFAGFTRFLSFEQKQTYAYLYGKTFVRSEMFGIVTRLTIAALLLFLVTDGTTVRGLVYGGALFMSAASISTLDQAHRYSFWLELYPISRDLLPQTIVRTAFTVLMIIATCLGGLLFLLVQNKTAAIIAAAGYGFVFIYSNISLRRRMEKH